MLKLNRVSILCLCAAVVTACGSPPPPDDDTLAEKLANVMEEAPEPPTLDVIAPDAVATLDRNQLASVLLVKLAPGERIPEHDAGQRALYALTDSSLLLNAGGVDEVQNYSAGEVDVWPRGRYGIENSGDETARFVVVNRTAAPLELPTEDVAAADDRAEAEPSTVLHSGEAFEIDRIELAPGTTRSVRCDNPCSVFTLTPATIVGDDEDGEPDVMDVFADRSVWFDGGTTWTVEAGDDAIALAVFEINK